jgi:hypothetical protein
MTDRLSNDRDQLAKSSPSDDPALREEVAEVAYARYLARGAGDGQDMDDWLAAEREVRNRHDRGNEAAGEMPADTASTAVQEERMDRRRQRKTTAAGRHSQTGSGLTL